MSLSLTFADGKVQGFGDDCVGRFVMGGSYDLESGRTVLHKRYVGAHEVLYEGWAETPHGIWGLWRIWVSRGGFQIWPASHEQAEHEHIEAEEPEHVETLEPAWVQHSADGKPPAVQWLAFNI